MNKLIIDIGTHEAQELRVLNGDRLYILKILSKWWFDWGKRQIKKVIRHPGLIQYGTGAYKISPIDFGISNNFRCLSQTLKPIDYLQCTRIIAIDPIASITTKYLKRIKTDEAPYFLPIAILPHNDDTNSKLTKFYNEKNSLSSSLTKSESSLEPIICSAYSFKKVIQELQKLNIIQNPKQITIRMNCEGSEFAIIKDLVQEGFIPDIVMGSINDVLKKYGQEEADKMNEFLKKHNIEFQYFKGSDPGTWLSAFKQLNPKKL
jgi:hypothetical protein